MRLIPSTGGLRITVSGFAFGFCLPKCSKLAQKLMAAFAKPLLPAGRFISRNLN
jgi:hypothetical protein